MIGPDIINHYFKKSSHECKTRRNDMDVAHLVKGFIGLPVHIKQMTSQHNILNFKAAVEKYFRYCYL